jgi:predicted MFS family arabinose efflux permease
VRAVIGAYRRVFATPRLRALMVVGLLAKIPGLGIPAVLILHVVYGLGLGFGPAGIVAAVWTAGVGVGAPFMGRGLDKYGLRPLLGIVIVVQAAFWGLAYLLPYPLLLCAAFVGGLLVLPAFTVIRLALAVMVTEDIRHTAYVADSISTDIAYMAGPSIGILLASQVSPTTAFLIMGGLLVLGAIGYAWVNPPLQAARTDGRAGRGWMSVQLVCVLVVTIGICLAVVGFEVAAIGTLQHLGQLRWSWVFLIVCGAASIAGGFVYGALRRPPRPALIAVCLGIAVIPIGFANHWLWLCVLAVPANFLVAPALSSTANAVSRLAPEGSRGVAMGAYASSLMIGNVAGSPLAGSALDLAGSVAAFAAVGGASALIAGVAFLAERRVDSPAELSTQSV